MRNVISVILAVVGLLLSVVGLVQSINNESSWYYFIIAAMVCAILANLVKED